MKFTDADFGPNYKQCFEEASQNLDKNVRSVMAEGKPQPEGISIQRKARHPMADAMLAAGVPEDALKYLSVEIAKYHFRIVKSGDVYILDALPHSFFDSDDNNGCIGGDKEFVDLAISKPEIAEVLNGKEPEEVHPGFFIIRVNRKQVKEVVRERN
jgi:hypothetical protein